MSDADSLVRFTVRETSPQVNQMNPAQPIYWHWSVVARSPEEAVAAVRAGMTGGRDQQIVMPLG
ncbi:hypothetical protein UNPF46_11445 [Bradyrhizobium sp. UNPF46]|uniref:hypothetical protein n=1 Tax=Bradyrhizobium sp. UNPF46 TaxID=1141168 RepID=UPI00114ED072|nr:hypothetical protein [Bradyrhizobium sp. UNPF46]TQF40073.1 hypothetical protein UNPF46_11445 [Bradyrhizobium sp. UNPF46]